MSIERTTKRITLILFSLLLVMGVALPARAGQIFISDNNVVFARIIYSYQPIFEVRWSNDEAQGYFEPIDLSATGEAYAIANAHLEVTVSGVPTDFRGIIYLRNWDNSGDANDADPLCTLSNTTLDIPKGLVRMNGGDAVIPMKWGRQVIGTNHQITIPLVANSSVWSANDGSWRWFLDETYQPDANFRLDTSQYGALAYSSFTTKAELSWAGTNQADIYLMAYYDPSTILPGMYKTNTLTIEILSE